MSDFLDHIVEHVMDAFHELIHHSHHVTEYPDHHGIDATHHHDDTNTAPDSLPGHHNVPHLQNTGSSQNTIEQHARTTGSYAQYDPKADHIHKALSEVDFGGGYGSCFDPSGCNCSAFGGNGLICSNCGHSFSYHS